MDALPAVEFPEVSADKTAHGLIEITFAPVGPQDEPDVVIMHRTPDLGPGGNNVYSDASGIVRAEVSGRGEVRMIATSAQQRPAQPLRCRSLEADAPADQE